MPSLEPAQPGAHERPALAGLDVLELHDPVGRPVDLDVASVLELVGADHGGEGSARFPGLGSGRALRPHGPDPPRARRGAAQAAVRGRVLGRDPGGPDRRRRADVPAAITTGGGAGAAGAGPARRRPGLRRRRPRGRRPRRRGRAARQLEAAAARSPRPPAPAARRARGLRPDHAPLAAAGRASAPRRTPVEGTRRAGGAPPLRPAARVLRPLPRSLDDLQLRDLLPRRRFARGGPGAQARARLRQARA